MLRQEVLNQYRTIIRCIRKIPDVDYRKELLEWTRRDFRSNSHHTDELTIRMLLNQGKRSLKELQQTINLAK